MSECRLHRDQEFDLELNEVCPACHEGDPSDAEREKFADDLYALVEADQGYAYISDGIGHLSRAEVIAIAKKSLSRHLSCARKLNAWLRKGGP